MAPVINVNVLNVLAVFVVQNDLVGKAMRLALVAAMVLKSPFNWAQLRLCMFARARPHV